MGVAMPPESGPAARPRRRRRLRVWWGVNATAALALAATLTLLANVLASRESRRWDVSRDRFYGLSEKTLTLLHGITNPVHVVCFFQREHPARHDLRELLREYAEACALLRVTWIDPDRDPARTKELAGRYGVTEANTVVVAAAGRSRQVSAEDLFDTDYRPLRDGQPPLRKAFRGEAALTSALDAVAMGRRLTVYFLQGHGERRPDSYDPRMGYSAVARAIRRDNIELRPLLFGEQQAVPDDCDALVVAGPVKRLAPSEVERIAAYLDRNGRALFLIDAHTDTGLEEMLESWQIRLGNDRVMDGTRTLTGRELFVSDYASHPITRNLQGITTILHMPRSVEPMRRAEGPDEAEDRPRAVGLAWTSPQGWAETAANGELPLRFDPGQDRPGPISVVAAAERGAIQGTGLRIRPARLVVIGDAQFVANGSQAGAGMDLFMNALNWLLERKELMGIAPKPVGQLHLVLNRRDQWLLFASVVLAWPAASVLAGLLVWARRRR